MTENELTGLLLKLADLGVTGVKVQYDGAGDSGAVEWIGYTKELCETPEDVNDNIDSWANDANLANIDQNSYNQIENFAYEILNDVEDWWNNEGGFGTLCISIPSGKYIINNHIRITETEDYFHDGSILDKAEE